MTHCVVIPHPLLHVLPLPLPLLRPSHCLLQCPPCSVFHLRSWGLSLVCGVSYVSRTWHSPRSLPSAAGLCYPAPFSRRLSQHAPRPCRGSASAGWGVQVRCALGLMLRVIEAPAEAHRAQSQAGRSPRTSCARTCWSARLRIDISRTVCLQSLPPWIPTLP
jgi:hypothetical protein